MSKGLIGAALAQAGAQALGMLYQSKVTDEAAEKKKQAEALEFTRELARDRHKVELEAKKHLLPLNDPTVQDHVAIHSGVTVPELQQSLAAIRSGKVDSQNLSFVAETNRRAKRALEMLTSGAGANRQAMAGADGVQAENMMRDQMLKGRMRVSDVAQVQGALKGSSAFDAGSGVVVNRYDGTFSPLPESQSATQDNSYRHEQIRTNQANTVQRMLDGVLTQIRANNNAAARALPNERESILAQNRTLEQEANQYRQFLQEQLIKRPAQKPAQSGNQPPVWDPTE